MDHLSVNVNDKKFFEAKTSYVLGILFGNSNYLLMTNQDDNLIPNFVRLDNFSPGRQIGEHLFFYRILCYDVKNNHYAQIAQKLFAVDAWFEMYEVFNNEEKLLFSNDPKKSKPAWISYESTPIESATDS